MIAFQTNDPPDSPQYDREPTPVAPHGDWPRLPLLTNELDSDNLVAGTPGEHLPAMPATAYSAGSRELTYEPDPSCGR